MKNPSAEKISDADLPPPTGVARVVAWFVFGGSERWLVRVRWSRVGSVAVMLTVLGYFTTAMAAFGFVRWVRNVEAARFVDIVLPWRWDNYRVARGNQQVTDAQRLVEQGKFYEALLFARSGVASAPANLEGRLLLAELFGAARRPHLMRETLVQGLRYHAHDPRYVKPVLTFLLQQQEDSHVVTLARRYLAEVAPTTETARLLALAAATASYFRGNFDQAEDFLRATPALAESRDGRLLGIKIERDRGYGNLAVIRLRQLAAEQPHDVEINRELLDALRRTGLNDEARRTSLSFQIAHPTLPGPRIALLHAYRESGDEARVVSEVDGLLRDFPADQGALLALGDFGANAGDVALVKRIAVQAEAQKLVTAQFAFLAVEAALVARDYRGALAAIRGYLADGSDWGQRYRALFDSLQALAYLGLEDPISARASLESFLGQSNLRVENLLAVANRFAAAGGNDQARRTLTRALEVDPLNQAALTRLVELDVTLNASEELAAHVQRLVRTRRPSPEVLRMVQRKLGSDLFLFAKDGPAALEAVKGALANAAESGPGR